MKMRPFMPGNKTQRGSRQPTTYLVEAQRNSKGPDGAEVRGHPVSESHKYAAAQHALSVHAQGHTTLVWCIPRGMKVWPAVYLARCLVAGTSWVCWQRRVRQGK